MLLPALYHGAPVLAYKYPQKFDAKKLQELTRLHKVKHMFLPPTALKMMKLVCSFIIIKNSKRMCLIDLL